MLQTITAYVRRTLSILLALLLVFGVTPASIAFADTVSDPTAPASSNSCSPVAPAPTGIQAPTGADAATYTYNSCTGLWENAYYTWSPATQSATPKTPQVYRCDQTTWAWVTEVWTYAPSSQSFVQAPTVAATLPNGAIIDASSLNPCTPAALAALQAAQATTNGPNSLSGSGASSSSSSLNTTESNGTTASLDNQLTSGAGSGNAAVIGNTTAGGATSGDASAMATVVNAVQSTSSLLSGPVTTFVANINGDVQGNLVIDPSQLQPASASTSLSGNNLNDLSVNNQTSGQITNTISLAATSGNATVASNTTAGSATTGNAKAVANVLNMLDSLVSSGKSFIGVVNINGNMRGNILVPQALLNNLIASNAPSTTVTLDKTQTNNLGITNTNNLSTTNNIASSATSGSATVSGNTSAGSATTGSATTQVRVFNLTGSQVVAANCLLVFVNVSGRWIGVIFNAPAGATAAALGSGVTTNTTNKATVVNTTNDAITNNINVSAASGNAAVTNNTTAGNATSGNASTAVNVLNMNDSQFNLTGWFGILFINIMGNWYGSVKAYDPGIVTAGRGGVAASRLASAPPRMFQFVPRVASDNPSVTNQPVGQLASDLVRHTGEAFVRLAKDTQPAKANQALNSQIIGGLIVAIGVSLFVTERFMTRAGRPSAK